MKLLNRLCIFFSLSLAGLAFAQTGHEGHDHAGHQHSTETFKDLNPKQADADMPPLVMEFFWYGCPHCYMVEPKVEAWLKNKPAEVKFVRVPAVMGRHWIPHAQAFYAAQRLGVLDKVHQPLFDAIHKDRKRLFLPEELAEFVGAAANLPPAQVLVEMQSEATTEKVKEAFGLARLYRLTGVPAFVVGGKYQTGTAMAGEDVMTVVDELLAKRTASK